MVDSIKVLTYQKESRKALIKNIKGEIFKENWLKRNYWELEQDTKLLLEEIWAKTSNHISSCWDKQCDSGLF